MLGRSKLIGDSGRVRTPGPIHSSSPDHETRSEIIVLMAKPSKNARCIQILKLELQGFSKKQNALYQYLETLETIPDVIATQDVGISVKFRSYSTHRVDPPTCILVHK